MISSVRICEGAYMVATPQHSNGCQVETLQCNAYSRFLVHIKCILTSDSV